MGDEVGEAVLNITLFDVTDCKLVMPAAAALECNAIANAPVAIDSFNACINTEIARLVSLKTLVGVFIVYVSLVSAVAVARDRDSSTESEADWMVISAALQS